MSERAKATSKTYPMPVWERAVWLALNLALISFLSLQIAVVFILKSEGEIPVPTFLLAGVQERLHEQDIDLFAQNVHFDLRGTLLFSNAQLLHQQSRLPLARADKLLVKISLLRLALGTISLEQLSLRNGVLLCPAPYSPSGVEEALVNNTRIDLKRQGNHWHIQRASGHMRTATVRLEGIVPDSIAKFEGQAGSNRTVGQIYLETARQAISQVPYLESFSDPILYATIGTDSNSQLTLHATLASKTWLHQDTLRAERPTLQISYQPLKPRQPLRLALHLKNLTSTEHDATIAALSVQASAHPQTESLTRASVFAESINVKEKHITDCWGEFDLRDFPYVSGITTLTFGDNESHVTLTGEADVVNSQAHFKYDCKAQLGDLSKLAEFDKFRQSDAPVLASGELTIEQGKPTQVSFEAYLRQLTIDHLTLALIAAKGQWTPEHISLENVEAHTPDWAVHGEYTRNLTNNEDQLYLRGTLNPHDLSPWMDHWWSDLWNNFVFGEDYMNINLEVRDFIGGGEPGYLFGYLHGKDFIFRSVPIDFCSTKVRMIPDYIEVFDLQPRGPSGYATVNIEWIYRPAYVSRYLVRFDAQGRLPLPEVDAISGGEITEVLDSVSTEQTPRLAVRGTVFGDTTPLAGRKHIDVTAYAPGIAHVVDLPMSNLSLEAFARPDKLRLENLNYTIAEGTGTGRAEIHHDTKGLLLDIALTEADCRTLFSFLPLITGDDKTDSDTDSEDNKLMDIDGKTDLSFLALGERGKLETFSADGSLHIYEADLGELHLLGGLSRLLAITPLRVGTFTFNDAKVPFHLEEGTLESTAITVDGPSARLQAYGSLNLLEDDLDLTVRLLMSKNISTPIIGHALRLLDPVTGSFIFNVTGSPEDPEWQIAVNPFTQEFDQPEEAAQ